MNKKQLELIGCALSLFIFTSCGGKQTQTGPARTAKVNTIEVPSGEFTTLKSYPTSMEGIVNSEARPKISGYITEVLVDEGQRVHKGQLLFKLETQSLSEEAQAAKANINAVQVQVDQLIPLVEKKIVSQSQLEAAKAKLAQAKANYASIVASIDYANVKSPVDGYVGEIRIRKGNLVGPTDLKPLTVVSDISKIYAYFTMNEKDYLDFILNVPGKTKKDKITNLPPVSLILANGEEYPHKGKIQTINSQVDPSTGGISFRAVFDNPEQLLTNGSTGTIRIPKTYKNELYVPKKSTFEQQGITYVLAIDKSGKATTAITKAVNVVDETKDFYLINNGVAEGDQIVAEGVDKIRTGTVVQTNPVPFDSVGKSLPALFIK